MKIFEVRDGFIKFEANESITPAGFILIEGAEKNYIGQIHQIRKAGIVAIAYAKILYIYDGQLHEYDDSLPSRDDRVSLFPSKTIVGLIKSEKPVIIGKTQDDKTNITVDASVFNKNLLASIDDKKQCSVFAQNLVKQFKHIGVKTLIIDTLGFIDSRKYTACKDFKLPLDTNSLAFMYDSCLNDATEDSKSLIIEIFKDLSEYSKTVPFVPFGTLKSIVDEMVDKSHIFKLLVLKNKLTKYDKLGYFARDSKEVNALSNIVNSSCAVLDLSKLDALFQNRYLAFIYDNLKNTKDCPQVLLTLSNTVTKKNLKQILALENISTSFITHSNFKYLSDIKNLFENYVITSSIKNTAIFDEESQILKLMSKDSFLLSGNVVNSVPIVSAFEIINDFAEYNYQKEDISDLLNNNEEVELTEDNDTNLISEDSGLFISESIESIENIENIENVDNSEELPSDEDIGTAGITQASDEIEENLDTDTEIDQTELNEDSSLEEITETEESEENEIQETDDTEDTDTPENFDTADDVTILENEIEITDNDTPDDFDALSDIDDSEINSIAEPENSLEEELIADLEESAEENDLADLNEPKEEYNITENLADNSDYEILEEDGPETETYDNIIEESETLDDEGYQEVIPLSDDNEVIDLPEESEIIELDSSMESDVNTDILVEMDEMESEEDALNEEIIQDVDKVFTTRKDDDISDSDLDFIDEINSDETQILEESDDDTVILEEPSNPEPLIEEEPEPFIEQDPLPEPEQEILEKRDSSTPIVPVYDAEIPQEDIVMSDPVQQGDTVIHAKYGTGVVEKMIKYGNKTLYAINFDNIGRRLLDPTLTEIKKG